MNEKSHPPPPPCKKNCILILRRNSLSIGSLRASSPIWASEASLGFAARSRVLARLVLLAQIGELARRLEYRAFLRG